MHAPTALANNPPADAAPLASIWLASPLGQRYFDPQRLSTRDSTRHQSLRNPVRAEEFAISRSLQQYLAVPDDTPQSLSHSGKYAAVALARPDTQVGIDIEQHRPRDLRSIAKFAFAAEECAAMEPLDDPALERAFYARWVMKEAVAKALQLPLLDAARDCRFLEADHGWTAQLPTSQCWRILAFEPMPGMSMAVALIGTGAACEPVRTYEWPPPRRVSWPTTANIFSGSEAPSGSPSLEESSTCRTLLPTS